MGSGLGIRAMLDFGLIAVDVLRRVDEFVQHIWILGFTNVYPKVRVHNVAPIYDVHSRRLSANIIE